MNKTPPARPNLGFTICDLYLFPPGFLEPEGHLYFKPPGQCSSEYWSNLSVAGGHQGQLWAGLSEVWTIRCALGMRYVQSYQDLSAHSGGFAGLVLPLSKCLVTGDSETDRVFPGEGISFVDRESLSWAKLGHPCRVISFESRTRGYEADGNLLMSGCRELVT